MTICDRVSGASLGAAAALEGAALMACLMPAGAAMAQEAEAVVLDVSYLAAPTDWCPADAGVPMIVAMNGPDIIKGPSETPRKVRERRGGQVSITHSGQNTAAFHRAGDFSGPKAEVIGRFAAEFRACLGALDRPRATGAWRVVGPDGAEVEAGVLADAPLDLPLFVPFFQPVAGPAQAYMAQFDDRLLYAAEKPAPQANQTFLAKPDKE
ncbi:hypothetical protein [Pseudotabrizicola sp. L79]|uniref:hypothetical protein n=1 Tax=Pseudotabrizicola sp. L79 TaxID=3118402 RepID=UPI002F953A2B